jgi:hypothetical protein
VDALHAKTEASTKTLATTPPAVMTAIDEEAEPPVEAVVLLVLSGLVGLDPVLVLVTWFHDLSSRDAFVFIVAAVLLEVDLLEFAPEIELLGVELLLEVELLEFVPDVE